MTKRFHFVLNLDFYFCAFELLITQLHQYPYISEIHDQSFFYCKIILQNMSSIPQRSKQELEETLKNTLTLLAFTL